jgi:cation transport regulator ChaB
MTLTIEDKLPKPVKSLPDEAKLIWVAEYNKDFGWRCSEAHAEKAAWNVVRHQYKLDGETWVKA